MKIILWIFILPFVVAFAYIVWSIIFYAYEEILYAVKKLKRAMKESIWEIEWQWKLFKEDLSRWITW